ncbi:MAG: flippase-like domain-containing protein [Eubacteriaceae bacterium]|jgi:uncharacterized protein (TIRG00374 family)|nr:flippase-like domain-containing protein [Eubacteriaceae bacterium]
MENEQKRNKKLVLSAVAFAVIVICVFAVVFRNCDRSTMMSALRGADPLYLAAGVGCMCLFVCCESSNIGRVLKTLGYKTHFIENLEYGASGFFFSGITPSASGGQPMQLYYMNRNKVQIAHGSLSLLVELMGFQLVSVILGIFGVIYDHSFITGLSTATQVLIYAGIAISVSILSVLIMLLFCPAAACFIERKMKVFCLKINKKQAIRKISKQMKEYRDGAFYIRKHIRVLAKNIAVTAVQLVAIYSVTYFVYRALGCSGAGWLEIFSLQALLNAGIAAVPLPGGTGAGEGAFKMIFAAIFTGGSLIPGMVLSRGLSFYLGMIITGMFLVIIKIRNRITADGIQAKKRETELNMRYRIKAAKADQQHA